MSHLYPLAASAAEALASPEPAARTRHEAEALAGEVTIGALETEWISPGDDTPEISDDAAEAGVGAGFVQRYEDAAGAPVYAVTYWKLETASKKKKASRPAKAPAKKAEDDTDELYFRSGRTKPRKKRRGPKIDPRQLDLFPGPDQKGYEYRDPDNPGVIIADEEGDGTSFGLAPKSTPSKEES
ncbi:MAG: hypothetical protein AAFW65_08865 [Pseudomonadota bacterium]